MTGVRLEVETQVVMALSSQVKNLTKCIYRTGVDIEFIVFSILATAEAVLTKKQKELGVAVVNIGSATTSLAVYEERNLLHAAILPIGSEYITNDIALGLRCPINLAERIKLEYGNVNPGNFADDEEVDITRLVKEEDVNDDIKRYGLDSIISIG
jgi:cell division protein FtsA